MSVYSIMLKVVTFFLALAIIYIEIALAPTSVIFQLQAKSFAVFTAWSHPVDSTIDGGYKYIKNVYLYIHTHTYAVSKTNNCASMALYLFCKETLVKMWH